MKLKKNDILSFLCRFIILVLLTFANDSTYGNSTTVVHVSTYDEYLNEKIFTVASKV